MRDESSEEDAEHDTTRGASRSLLTGSRPPAWSLSEQFFTLPLSSIALNFQSVYELCICPEATGEMNVGMSKKFVFNIPHSL